MKVLVYILSIALTGCVFGSCGTSSKPGKSALVPAMVTVRVFDNHTVIERVRETCSAYQPSKQTEDDDKDMPGLLIITIQFDNLAKKQKRELQFRLEKLGGVSGVKIENKKNKDH